MPAPKKRITEEQKQNLLHWSATAEGERAAARDIIHKVLDEMGGVNGVAQNIVLLMQEGGNSVAKQRATQEFMRLLTVSGNRLGPPPDLGLATDEDLQAYLERLIDERFLAQENQPIPSHSRPKDPVMVAQEAESFVMAADQWENIMATLAQKRREQKIDQTTVARKLQITQSSFSYYESGAKSPPLRLLPLWAKELGLKIGIGFMADKTEKADD